MKLIGIPEAYGRVIKDIKIEEMDGLIAIFVDDPVEGMAALVLQAEHAGDYGFDISPTKVLNPHELHLLGFIDRAEYDRLTEQARAEAARYKEALDRQQYERLKAKFEGR